ncbi:hypothetical protein KDA82_25365, partial [Streptomyces daliensis]|nr:hypothetical protein [Streptomyces daliensis]
AVTACAIVEAGLLAYTVGAVLAGYGARHPATLLGPVLARRVSPARMLLLCLFALAVAVVLIPGQGGLGAFFTSRQAVNESAAAGGEESAGRAVATWTLSAPAFWALLALLHVPRGPGGDRLVRGLRWALLPLLLALNVVVNNPISQPRFWAGTVLLTLLFAAPALRRPRGFRIATAAILTAVLVVFPYGDYFRNDKRDPVQVVSLAEQFTTNGDYDAYQQLQTGVSVARDEGLAPLGALGPPLFFVPRAVWDGKPEDTGIRLARHAGYRFDNLSAPLWIESYLWGGFPAVVLVFGLYGALGRRIDDVRHRTRELGGTLAVLLVPALAFFQLILLRGSLMASMGPLALLVLVGLCVSGRGDYRERGGTGGRPAAPVSRAVVGTAAHDEPRARDRVSGSPVHE